MENKARQRSGEARTKGKGWVSGSKEEEMGIKFNMNRAKDHQSLRDRRLDMKDTIKSAQQ